MILEDDLRDACKPGDRVAVAGIYKPVAPRANGSVSGASLLVWLWPRCGQASSAPLAALPQTRLRPARQQLP